jgi:DNA-binding CsgD family transcriptional regulator
VSRQGNFDEVDPLAGPPGDNLLDAFGLLELPLLLVGLDDQRVQEASELILKRLGLPSERVIDRPFIGLLRESDRDGAAAALAAMRDGVIDFYRAHRRFQIDGQTGLPYTAWARALTIDEQRFSLIEVDFGDESRASPIGRLVGEEPPTMALGAVDSSWVITSVSSEIESLIGRCAADVVGRHLLGTLAQADVQRVLDAGRLVTEEYSVARRIRMRNASGDFQPLCCVLTSLATADLRSFILIPIDNLDEELAAPRRARQLEKHLLRIAAELDASGVLQRVGTMPDVSRWPQLGELSSRQWEVLTRLLRGERVATIAEEMFVSPSTVRNHLSAIFERFWVHSQAELLALLHSG